MRKYDINDFYFESIDSEIKAYLLGFFLADGTFGLSPKSKNSYRFCVKVQQEDDNVIRLFQKYIAPNSPIFYKEPYIDKNNVKHKGVCYICWTSSIMSKILESYNILPRKTYDLDFTFPFDKIPNIFIWDFIRGFFDGDGQFSYSPKTHQTTFALYGTSYKFMTDLGNLFEEQFNVSKRVEAVKKSKIVLYTLRFSANYNRKGFMNSLYKEFYKNKHFFLRRKQENILNYLLFKYRDNPEDCERLQDIVERRD